MQEIQTLQQLWDEGRKRLKEAGVTECDLDARYLLFDAFHLDMVHFLIWRNDWLDTSDSRITKAVEQYRQWIKKRAERIPFQYLTGKQEFMGLEFFVNEHVLIPRQDTETLVELVLERCPQNDRQETGSGQALRLLDMCTGSGCIGISLAALGGYRDVTAVDISRQALEIACKNAAHCLKTESFGGTAESFRGMAESVDEVTEPFLPTKGPELAREAEMLLKLEQAGNQTEAQAEFWKKEVFWKKTGKTGFLEGRITLIESDLFQNLDKSLKYDMIVSNPPYIASMVIEGLEPEVRDHEPRLALDGTEDGLYFYRRLAEEGRDYLVPGGRIAWEIGYDQGEAVVNLLRNNGFRNLEIVKDKAGLDRVVYGYRE